MQRGAANSCLGDEAAGPPSPRSVPSRRCGRGLCQGCGALSRGGSPASPCIVSLQCKLMQSRFMGETSGSIQREERGRGESRARTHTRSPALLAGSCTAIFNASLRANSLLISMRTAGRGSGAVPRLSPSTPSLRRGLCWGRQPRAEPQRSSLLPRLQPLPGLAVPGVPPSLFPPSPGRRARSFSPRILVILAGGLAPAFEGSQLPSKGRVPLRRRTRPVGHLSRRAGLVPSGAASSPPHPVAPPQHPSRAGGGGSPQGPSFTGAH